MIFCDYPIIRDERKLPLYLLNMGHHQCQDHIIRPEGYPCPQILYCTKGSGTLILDGEKISFPHHNALFLPANHPHEYYPEEDVWDIHWIVPAGYAAEDILRHFGLCEPKLYELRDVISLETIFRKMHESVRGDSVFGNYRASGYLYDFLIEFYHQTAFATSPAAPNPALIKAIDYITMNYSKSISMEELCNAAGVSKQYICHLFRTTLNTRPTEYISKRRIQAAKELLTGTDMTIEEIAEKVGFCSSSYFCKLFKRYEGISPTRFKNTL